MPLEFLLGSQINLTEASGAECHMPVSPTPSLSRLTPISVFALSCQKGFRPGIDAACLSLQSTDRVIIIALEKQRKLAVPSAGVGKKGVSEMQFVIITIGDISQLLAKTSGQAGFGFRRSTQSSQLLL